MKKIAVLVSLLAALVTPALADIQVVSSATLTNDSAQSVGSGKLWLYKVIVSSAGLGSKLTIVNANLSQQNSTMTAIDTTVVREYEFDLYISSGLMYYTTGTSPAGVTILYSRRIPTTNPLLATSQIEENRPYSFFYSTGAITTKNIRAGRTYLKKVLVTMPGAAGSLITVYNSSGTANNKVAEIDGGAAIGTVRDFKYSLILSSGLTFTATSTPTVTFVYDMF